jgi:hypothetical protein
MMHPLERVAQWITRGSKMLSATDPMVLRTMAAIFPAAGEESSLKLTVAGRWWASNRASARRPDR